MITLNVNGKDHSLDVSEDTPVLWAIRDVIGFTGTKFGCGMACLYYSFGWRTHALLCYASISRSW